MAEKGVEEQVLAMERLRLFRNGINVFLWCRAFFSKILFEICLHLWGSAIHSFINRCFNINPNIS